MNAKPIAWALVTATAGATSMGIFEQEFGLAVASVMFGAAALAASVLAWKTTVTKRSSSDRINKLEVA